MRSPDKHLFGEGVEGDQGREPADELGDHAELDEVLGLDLRQVGVLLPLVLEGGEA